MERKKDGENVCVSGLAIQYTNVGGRGMKGVWTKKFQRFK